MTRTLLLTAAAVIALNAGFARAEDAAPAPRGSERMQAAFPQTTSTFSAIKSWFGRDNGEDANTANPEAVEPAAGEPGTNDSEPFDQSAAASDALGVPPPVPPELVEPAAGGFDQDSLSAPPPYYGPESNGTPRATAFDNASSAAAFKDNANTQSPEAMAGIVPAGGNESAPDASKMDCDAILKAADNADENEIPDTGLIEACEATKEEKTPAQPAFGSEPEGQQNALPGTQPAAGEPPIGGAVMPGEEAPKD
jgi:hypothetical protein